MQCTVDMTIILPSIHNPKYCMCTMPDIRSQAELALPLFHYPFHVLFPSSTGPDVFLPSQHQALMRGENQIEKCSIDVDERSFCIDTRKKSKRAKARCQRSVAVDVYIGPLRAMSGHDASDDMLVAAFPVSLLGSVVTSTELACVLGCELL